VIAVFFVQGFLFASWTAHIPRVQQNLGLSNGRLGLALLGAPVGSVLALVLAGRLLTRGGVRCWCVSRWSATA
jgi:MFS family permease